MKTTTKSTNGTSFHDTTIRCSVNDLREILGEPINESNDGSDKVNFEWEMETDDGYAFTVYDWKEYRPLDEYEIIEWHIGGYNGRITEQAKKEIIKFL
jgi:hypothetical protein